MKGVVFTLIRGFFGDNINRAVSETVNAAVSPANVAVYCKVFKDSMWFVKLKLNQTNRNPPQKKTKRKKKHQLSHFGILVIPGGLLRRALSALGAAASMLHHSAVYADVRTPIC